MKIESHTQRGPELDKRAYLPFVVSDNCPKCGKTCTIDLRRDYLSYPTVGKPYALTMTCSDESGRECSEWNVAVVVGFTLTAAEEG